MNGRPSKTKKIHNCVGHNYKINDKLQNGGNNSSGFSLLFHSSIGSFFWSSSPASLSVPRQTIPHMACITTSSRTLFGRNILGWCWLKLVCRWPLNCSSSRLSFALVSPMENMYFRAFRANEHRVCCGNMTIATCTFVHSFEHFFCSFTFAYDTMQMHIFLAGESARVCFHLLVNLVGHTVALI